MTKRKSIAALIMLAPLLAISAGAQEQGAADPSQETGAAPRPQRDESLVLEEVIVTASRREQSLQEVPMSVSAFTSEFFQDSGVNNLAGLEQYTPSLKITPGTDSRSTISWMTRMSSCIASHSLLLAGGPRHPWWPQARVRRRASFLN